MFVGHLDTYTHTHTHTPTQTHTHTHTHTVRSVVGRQLSHVCGPLTAVPYPNYIPDVNNFQCCYCGKQFPGGLAHLSRHVEGVHLRKRFYCDNCGKSYTQKDNLKRHQKCCSHGNTSSHQITMSRRLESCHSSDHP